MSVSLIERKEIDALLLLVFFPSSLSGMLFVPKVWDLFILSTLGVVKHGVRAVLVGRIAALAVCETT